MENIDIKSVMQIIIPNVQNAAVRVLCGVGRFHVGLESQVILPDGTQSVTGKAKSSSQICLLSRGYFFLIFFAMIFEVLFALDYGFLRICDQ